MCSLIIPVLEKKKQLPLHWKGKSLCSVSKPKPKMAKRQASLSSQGWEERKYIPHLWCLFHTPFGKSCARKKQVCRCHILFEQMSQWLWVYHLDWNSSQSYRQQKFIRLGLWPHNKAAATSELNKTNNITVIRDNSYTGFIIHQALTLISPFYWWGNWGGKKLNESCPRSQKKVVQLGFEFSLTPESVL